MRFEELLTEKRKRKSKRKNKYGTPVWGPGPYGLYGWDTGYSGDGGSVGEQRKFTEMELAVMEGGHALTLDKPTPSLSDIAKKHEVSYKYVLGQMHQGIRVELEHTSDAQAAKEIALDHLSERPDYYERLKQVENFADGKNPGRKGLSKRVGIPKKASLGQLEKIASSSSGERRRMAQWQLNMRRGKKK
jgi:hypothetical protein